jgi:hypothetical protein
MATTLLTRQQIIQTIQDLPAEALPEIAQFIEFVRFKAHSTGSTPYTPVALGGLWAGVTITEADIQQARREMWGNFGERVTL